MALRKAFHRFLEEANRYSSGVALVATGLTTAAFVTTHTLKYNLAGLVTNEQLQKQSDKQSEQLQKQSDKQSEQLQKQSDKQSEQLQKYLEQLRADLRSDLRTVPALEGRVVELSKATSALINSRERRPWW
jgi:ATP-dependent 26S proteasome regulatory subunit